MFKHMATEQRFNLRLNSLLVRVQEHVISCGKITDCPICDFFEKFSDRMIEAVEPLLAEGEALIKQ